MVAAKGRKVLSGTDGQNEYEDLLQDYVSVCNRVLQENRDRFPYSHIWRAAEEALSGRAIKFAVFDDQPKAECTISIEANVLSEKTEALQDEAPVMRLSAQYMEDVVSNPEKYVGDPSLIDWGWLKPPEN